MPGDSRTWMSRTAQIEALLSAYLPRQRWYGGRRPPTEVRLTSLEVRQEQPLLLWLLVDVRRPGAGAGEPAPARYQLLLGGRPEDGEEDFLLGKERVTLGVIDGTVLYDALVDPELALEVLTLVAPDESARVARPLLVEQSNTSVVYDERLILKLFRQLHAGPNPDVEVNRVLGAQGFPHVVGQLAELGRDGMDLAVVRDYMRGSTDAWQLAHTSLRDMLGARVAPEAAGGDFAPEAAALGSVTASLHVALASAFGVQAAAPDEWYGDMRAQLARVPANGLDRDRVASALETRMQRVRQGDAGKAIRVHGDLHLGQVLRSDTGWYVLDFEGEPARPLAERVHPSSPLRDVAGMLRSFHYASRAVLVERGRDVDPELAKLSEAWEERAAEAFQQGYLRVPGVAELLPPDEDVRQALLGAFVLDKAVYEVGYELAHRPSWVDIPASAIQRFLEM